MGFRIRKVVWRAGREDRIEKARQALIEFDLIWLLTLRRASRKYMGTMQAARALAITTSSGLEATVMTAAMARPMSKLRKTT